MILPQIEVIGIYVSQKARPNVKISPNRKTTMFEIELPAEAGGISHIDDEAMPITERMIICAKPGQTRHTRFPFKCWYVHMQLESGYLYDTLMQLPSFITIDRPEVYRTIFEKLITYHDTRLKQDEIALQSLILELIYRLSQESSSNARGQHHGGSSPAIRRALRYIRDNLTEDLSLEAVASQVSLSPVHFHKAFKSAVGQTLHQYVEEQRIKRAIDLLITTDMTLTEIAFKSGFSSQSYFSYVFKRSTGTTPRKYVEKVQQMYER